MEKAKEIIKITVLGAGMWGTTIAGMLAGKGYIVNLWARSRDVYEDIKNNRTNKKYTGQNLIPQNVKVFLYSDKKNLFTGTNVVVFAVPSYALRETILYMYKELENNAPTIKAIVNAAKGMELATNLRLSDVMGQVLPGKLKNITAFLSGPNIAAEILKKLPSVSTISSENERLLEYLQAVFTNNYFRVYTNTDIIGVEICAAVKNIIAIAAGISDGLGFGANAKASLITRGLHELSKIGISMGANPATFNGIAGMGDLIATCISPASRNRTVGERLAKGESMDSIKENMYMVAEGINTAKIIYEISREKNIDLPITESVYNIIYKGLNPSESVDNLMTRKFKSEI